MLVFKKGNDGEMGVVMKKFGIIFTLLFSVLFIHAKYEKIRSASKFYKYLEPGLKDQLALTIALFYDKDEGKVPKDLSKEQRKIARDYHKEIKKRLKEQTTAFKNTSKAFKEVDFLSVDLADKDNIQLRDAYNISYYPTLKLFKKGEPVVDANNKPVEQYGDFSQGIIFEEPDISQLVRSHFGDEIDMIIKAKAKAQWELDKLRAAAPKYYGGWGWGYGGWGYGGWGWGYPGWGWGYGRGCCW